MTDRKFEIKDATGGAAFTVRCVTRAVRTAAVGVQEDGSLKVRLMASPAGSDEANQELITFLALTLGVDANTIEIVAGHEGREKLISVEGVTTRHVEEKLAAAAQEADDED